jgi:hypothetical protein
VVGIDDAVDREAAWLTTVGDGLPALLASAGGLWDAVQVYWPRPMVAMQRTIYVTLRNLTEDRFANVRLMDSYEFRLVLWWPISSGTGNAQQDQRDRSAAIKDLITRVQGFPGDKTHGGRFLSVGERPPHVRVEFDPEESTIAQGYLKAVCTYSADDPEVTG